MSTRQKSKQNPQKNRAQAQTRSQTQAQAPKKPAAPTPDMLAAEQAKRDARLQRQQEAQAAARRRKRNIRLRNIGIMAAIALVIAGSIAVYMIGEANKPGELVSMLPSSHIPSETTPHAPYNTDPPTSGPHTQEVPPPGAAATPVPKEKQVHFLEDAGVVISYKAGVDQATVDRLAALVRSYGREVLLTQHPGPNELSNPIVLTAWRRIDRLEVFDEARIKKFIDAYRGKDHHGESGT